MIKMFVNIGVFQTLADKVVTILLLGSILVSITTAHQCYICGSFVLIGNGKSNRNSAESCANFNPNDSKFIQECGTDSRGCSIITNGSIVTRSCEKFAIEDCKMANNVEYCYCSAELCNKFHPTFIDDEDLIGNEGSGDKTVKTTGANTEFVNEKQTSTTVKKDTTTTRNVTNISTKLTTVPEITEKSVTNTKPVTATPEITKMVTNATITTKQVITKPKNITELSTTTKTTVTTKENNITIIRSKIPEQTDNPEIPNGTNFNSYSPKYQIIILLLFIIFLNY